MSKRIEECNLEPVMTRKATIRSRSPKATDGDRMAPKKTSKSTARSKSIGKRRLVKKEPVAKKIALAEKNLEAYEIPIVEATSQVQGLLQEIAAPAVSEMCPDLALTMSPDMGCEAIVLETAVEEKEMGDQEKEPGIRTDLAEARQSPELRRRGMLHWLAETWNWARKQLGSRQSRKRLRVCESVSLGEKRFVAVIEVDGEQFLVGGASSSVATLARLGPSQEFADMLRRRWAQDPVQA
jgi:hypothetical protein